MKPYDPECETLAEHFLQFELRCRPGQNRLHPDDLARYERRVRSLAEAIQDAVEAWDIGHMNSEAER